MQKIQCGRRLASPLPTGRRRASARIPKASHASSVPVPEHPQPDGGGAAPSPPPAPPPDAPASMFSVPACSSDAPPPVPESATMMGSAHALVHASSLPRLPSSQASSLCTMLSPQRGSAHEFVQASSSTVFASSQPSPLCTMASPQRGSAQARQDRARWRRSWPCHDDAVASQQTK